MSTLLLSQDQVGPDLVGSPLPSIVMTGSDLNDSESRYLGSVGVSGRAAFWKALSGPVQGSDDTPEADGASLCYVQAAAPYKGSLR